MADPRFFTKSGSYTVAELAALSGAVVEGNPTLRIEDVAPLGAAQSKHLSFLDNNRYKDDFTASKAGACFVAPDAVALAPTGMTLLVTKYPYKAYALAAQHFYPDAKPAQNISAQALIDSGAEIAQGCVIEAGVVIMDGSRIGPNCRVEANAVIGRHVVLGQGCRIGSNASLSHCVLGDHVRIYPGARIGQDGFGFAIDPAGHVKVPQLGRVIIEDSVEIGANTTIDRGAGPDTVIGQGTWIDNLVQIGHNVRIGKGCVIVAQTGISGSSVLEDYVVLAGQVGIAGHLRIGKGARIAAQSGIMRDVPPGEEQMGYPALPLRQFMRQIATLNRLTQKKKSA